MIITERQEGTTDDGEKEERGKLHIYIMLVGNESIWNRRHQEINESILNTADGKNSCTCRSEELNRELLNVSAISNLMSPTVKKMTLGNTIPAAQLDRTNCHGPYPQSSNQNPLS